MTILYKRRRCESRTRAPDIRIVDNGVDGVAEAESREGLGWQEQCDRPCWAPVLWIVPPEVFSEEVIKWVCDCTWKRGEMNRVG